jgi:hypothetical protein
MAYTTPRTWVAGEIVDKDMMNEQVRDNIAYLKSLADDNESRIDTINNTTLKSASLTKRTDSNQLNTVFKNGSKLRLVTAVCIKTGISYHVVIEANNITTPLGAFSPPTSWAVLYTREPEDSTMDQVSITFIVPPLYYYTVASRGAGPDPSGHVEISYADLF